MAKDSKEHQKEDAQRIPEQGTGKLDQERLVEGIQHPTGGAPEPGGSTAEPTAPRSADDQ